MSWRRTTLVAVVLVTSAVLAGCSSDEPARPKAKATASPSPTETPGFAIGRRFFGMHDHAPAGASWPDGPVGSLRLWDSGVTWQQIETSPGVFAFSLLDQIVDTAEQHNADALIVLGQTPAFHANDPTSPSFYGEGASSPPDIAAWRNYVRTVAERYKGRDVSFQVWNEVNVDGFWQGSAAEMAQLTKVAHDVLATITPRPRLVAPAFVTRLSTQRQWMDEFYAQQVDGRPVADLIDVVSLQLYPTKDGTPEDSMEIYQEDRAILDKYGVDKPVWTTEVNYGLAGSGSKLVPVAQQRANVARTYLLNAANGIERVYWYAWDLGSGIANTQLTLSDSVTVSPAGETFRLVHDWMAGTTMRSCDADAAGTYTCVLEHDGGVRRVYWNPTSTATVELPEDATSVQHLNGKTEPATPGTPIDVAFSPVMVEATG